VQMRSVLRRCYLIPQLRVHGNHIANFYVLCDKVKVDRIEVSPLIVTITTPLPATVLSEVGNSKRSFRSGQGTVAVGSRKYRSTLAIGKSYPLCRIHSDLGSSYLLNDLVVVVRHSNFKRSSLSNSRAIESLPKYGFVKLRGTRF